MPTAHNSKTIYGTKMRFGMILENHKLIILVQFNCQRTSLLRHNDVINVETLHFYKNLPIKISKV